MSNNIASRLFTSIGSATVMTVTWTQERTTTYTNDGSWNYKTQISDYIIASQSSGGSVTFYNVGEADVGVILAHLNDTGGTLNSPGFFSTIGGILGWQSWTTTQGDNSQGGGASNSVTTDTDTRTEEDNPHFGEEPPEGKADYPAKLVEGETVHIETYTRFYEWNWDSTTSGTGEYVTYTQTITTDNSVSPSESQGVGDVTVNYITNTTTYTGVSPFSNVSPSQYLKTDWNKGGNDTITFAYDWRKVGLYLSNQVFYKHWLSGIDPDSDNWGDTQNIKLYTKAQADAISLLTWDTLGAASTSFDDIEASLPAAAFTLELTGLATSGSETVPVYPSGGIRSDYPDDHQGIATATFDVPETVIDLYAIDIEVDDTLADSTITEGVSFVSRSMVAGLKFPNDRLNNYDPDQVWDEETEQWIDIDEVGTGDGEGGGFGLEGSLSALGGGRYNEHIVTLSDRGQIYFGSFT